MSRGRRRAPRPGRGAAAAAACGVPLLRAACRCLPDAWQAAASAARSAPDGGPASGGGTATAPVAFGMGLPKQVMNKRRQKMMQKLFGKGSVSQKLAEKRGRRPPRPGGGIDGKLPDQGLVPNSAVRRLEHVLKIEEWIEDRWRILEEEYQKMEGNRDYWERKGKTERVLKFHKGHSYHFKAAEYEELIASWLPDVFSAKSRWREPLDPQEVEHLFSLFASPKAADLLPHVKNGVGRALGTADLGDTVVVLQGLVGAKLAYPLLWKEVGSCAMRNVNQAAPGEIAELAVVLAMARDAASPILFDALQGGLASREFQVPEANLRELAARCHEVDLSLPAVFGPPPASAPPGVAEETVRAVARLGAAPGAFALCREPLPLSVVPDVVSPAEAEALIALADAEDLWTPSARRGAGGGDPGAPVPGRPWSALLDGPRHRTHPAVAAVRHWLADALGVPPPWVEPLRVLRYRAGERSGAPSADARPAGDASLWWRGQRAAVALVNLRTLPDGVGGEIAFQALGGLRVAPGAAGLWPAGSALIWPAVDASGQPLHELAAREALPVLQEGKVKYTLAAWVRSLEPLSAAHAPDG